MIRYSRACGSYQDFLDRGSCEDGSYWNKGSIWKRWSHHFENVTVTTMTWLTAMEYLCHNDQRYVPLSKALLRPFLIHDLLSGL
jgi:hypothetical protein